MDAHLARILVWFVMSLVIDLFFWFNFTKEINKALKNASMCREHIAKKEHINLPRGWAEPDWRQSLNMWNQSITNNKLNRLWLMFCLPGMVAILVLFSLP